MPEDSITAAVAHLVAQLGVILLAAKLGAEFAARVLKQPAVLGELAAGVLIGPHALGGIPLPILGVLFEAPGAGPIPVSTELFALAQIASVVLLFLVGLETDLRQFLRFGPAASAVALGGVLLPFAFGDAAMVLMGFAPSFDHPGALFMGAILTATSVGITARVLADIGKLDTAEGVTILAGAVVDDVLGILALAVAVGVGTTGTVSLLDVGAVGAKAIAFWLALTVLALLLAGQVSRLFLSFRTDGAVIALALGTAFLAAFLAESFGLALIIGAYSVGLALSQTPLGRNLEESLRSVYHALVPVFFVVMGMLVDVSAMGHAVTFGVVITVLAIIGKLLGAAVPALAVGFTPQGALRIGLGMLPRGEVALIVAGVGMASGIIGSDVFGVAILMTVVTTVLAPIFLVPAFVRGGPGRREAPRDRAPSPQPAVGGRYTVEMDEWALDYFLHHLRQVLEQEGFHTVVEARDPEGPEVTEYQREGEYLSVAVDPSESGRRRLVVEFATPRWGDILLAAVRRATREVVDRFLEPFAGGPDGQRRETLLPAMSELLASLERR